MVGWCTLRTLSVFISFIKGQEISLLFLWIFSTWAFCSSHLSLCAAVKVLSSQQKQKKKLLFYASIWIIFFFSLYFLVAIVLLSIAALINKMCENFKVALTKFSPDYSFRNLNIFNTKCFETQGNSMPSMAKYCIDICGTNVWMIIWPLLVLLKDDLCFFVTFWTSKYRLSHNAILKITQLVAAIVAYDWVFNWTALLLLPRWVFLNWVFPHNHQFDFKLISLKFRFNFRIRDSRHFHHNLS